MYELLKRMSRSKACLKLWGFVLADVDFRSGGKVFQRFQTGLDYAVFGLRV